MSIAIGFDTKPHAAPPNGDGVVAREDGNGELAESPIGKALIGMAPFRVDGATLFLRGQRHVTVLLDQDWADACDTGPGTP